MKTIRTDGASQSWLRSANCDARYGAALLAALGMILGLCASGESGREALRYQRAALAHGQWWRLLIAHALLNSAGLVLLWMLFAREFSARRWAWILLTSSAAIDAGLWFLRPAVDWYLGA